jgi:hypothetical protein
VPRLLALLVLTAGLFPAHAEPAAFAAVLFAALCVAASLLFVDAERSDER